MVIVTEQDLQVVADEARKQYLAFPHRGRLPTLSRDLRDSEIVALSWIQAAVMVLNGKGAIRMEALQQAELRTPDSEPMVDEHDWIDVDTKS